MGVPLVSERRNPMTKVALFVRLQAKPGKESDVEKFLAGALPAAQSEGQTPVWFALKFGKGEFGIFDAFADESGRKAHLSRPIPAALMAPGGELLPAPPKSEPIHLLACKTHACE